MKLRDLLTLVRNDLDDATAPYLWSDEELIEYAVDAENEACRRARLIIDSSTTAVCSIAVTATNPLLSLDNRVLFVRRAKLVLDDRPLGRASMRDLDNAVANWEVEATTPAYFIPDFETGKLRLYPVPVVNDTLKLTVVRLPLTDMNDLEDTPEIKPHYHRSLRYWVLHRAYLKQDAETKDDNKAATNLTLFEAEFGKKSSAVDEEWIEREQAYDSFAGVY